MTNTVWKLWLAFLASVAAGGGISSACDLNMRSTAITDVAYASAQRTPSFQKLRLSVENTGAETCSGQFKLELPKNVAHNFGKDGAFEFSITAPQSIQKVIYDTRLQHSVPLQVNLEPGRRIELQPGLVLPPDQTAMSGQKHVELSASFTPTDNPTNHITEPVFFRVTVKPVVSANFVGTDRGSRAMGGASLDLGELQTGKRRRFGLQLRANSRVDISITSENRGALQHTNKSDEIPYDLVMRNRRVPLNGGPTQMQTSASSASGVSNGRTIPMVVIVGDTSEARAGRYSDVIVMRVSAR